MADPVKKPLTWSKSYPAYAERHDMFRVFQELLKEIIIVKPLDPLAYIKAEISKVAAQLHVPRVFLIGPNVTTQGVGRRMAQATGCRYLTLGDVVETAPPAVRGVLAAYVNGEKEEEAFDENLRKLLVATIMQRVRCADCAKRGYILYGFPQNKAQATCAQQTGLLPRQVFALLPDPFAVSVDKPNMMGSNSNPLSSTPTGHTPATNSTSDPSPQSQTTQHTMNTVQSGLTVSQSMAASIMGTGSPSMAVSNMGTAAPVQQPHAPPHDTASHPTSTTLLIYEENGNLTKISSQVILPDISYQKMKEVVDCYDYEICKSIQYEKWTNLHKKDVDAELLGNLVSIKPCGSPWIPRILVLGPPYSGKSTMAEQLSATYGFVNVDFINCVRGAARIPDDVGKACKKYLTDLNPLDNKVVKTLIQKRLLQRDCEKKGWILHGFPDTLQQLDTLDALEITPNRAFYMACPEDVCWTRLLQKREEVLKRKLVEGKGKRIGDFDEKNFEDFPYGKVVFRVRTDNFYDNFDALSDHFGKDMIYVDAAQKITTIYQFMDASVLRPPVVRYQQEEPPE